MDAPDSSMAESGRGRNGPSRNRQHRRCPKRKLDVFPKNPRVRDEACQDGSRNRHRQARLSTAPGRHRDGRNREREAQASEAARAPRQSPAVPDGDGAVRRDAALGKQAVPFGLTDTVNPFTASTVWHAFGALANSVVLGYAGEGLGVTVTGIQGGAQFRAANAPVEGTAVPSRLNNFAVDVHHEFWLDAPAGLVLGRVAMPWPRSQRTARHRTHVRQSAPRR